MGVNDHKINLTLRVDRNYSKTTTLLL